ncbi:tRNA pseudouridine(38/39) synthase-like isoform X2 [Hydractinia symbiolongicarpus]|uniref:tRNA pseudouridine(38/39) synthase-like isoform X2 n=1 Tax=Hydractinia symbiolongicarpus TaxID=13093 RepID=UPI0025518C74|nr:tRNA pseudouridine(38/39) synthase-like isoform X2 [Hydractinia symbiolongicarpus]
MEKRKMNVSESTPDGLQELSQQDLISKCEELLKSNQELKKRLANCQQNQKSESKTKRKEHKQRPIDFSKYSKRHIAFKFLYLGWDYQGFAAQENTSNTIEEELFAAFLKSKLIKDRASARYSRCGRTDKGVSAFGQVIALDVRSNLSSGVGVTPSVKVTNDSKEELPYVKMLNRLLPPEIRILAHAAVDNEFDARFSCKTRKYRYYFPALNLDVELMQKAAQKLVGEKDFRNFCKVDVGNNINHFIRNIVSFDVTRIGQSSLCMMEITGLAFLWHQVRCMAAVLILIGLGHEKPEILDYLLDVEKCPKRPQYGMASDVPLVLFDCTYDDNVKWIYEQDCNENNMTHLQQVWIQKAVQSTMIGAMMDDLQSHSTVSSNNSASQLSSILPGYRKVEYKPLNKRAVCGLDRHMEKLAAKRLKLEEKSRGEQNTDILE